MKRTVSPLFATLFLLLFIQTHHAIAQYEEVGLGFKAGLNYSTFHGPLETGANGEPLEEYTTANGFHIGGIVNIKFTDLVGLRTEFTYSQRGTKYEYNGPSYYTLEKYSLTELDVLGTRRQTMKVTNAYIDVPLMAYYKIGYFEVFGGINSSLLVASTAGGNIEFNGVSPSGNAIDPFIIRLDHNYKADEATMASDELQEVDVDGPTYLVPVSTGAYYDFESRDKNLYKTLDFGLIAGLSYYLNDNLFLSARYIHGLTDVDRNEYDVSLRSTQPNGNLIARADKNTSRSYQFSLGFSF
jgi:opacity protein-like surface antigen